MCHGNASENEDPASVYLSKVEKLRETGSVERNIGSGRPKRINATESRVIGHQNDNWKRTFFVNETTFSLFRNTIRVWHKAVRRGICRKIGKK
jgi:hypothetical protein